MCIMAIIRFAWLSMPFTKRRDEARAKEVLRVLLGDELAASLRENNLFALPDTVRRKLTIDLDLGE